VELARDGVIKLADRVYCPVRHSEAWAAVGHAANIRSYQRDLYECNHIADQARAALIRRAALTPWPAPAAFGLIYTTTHAMNVFIDLEQGVWVIDNNRMFFSPKKLAGSPIVLLLM